MERDASYLDAVEVRRNSSARALRTNDRQCFKRWGRLYGFLCTTTNVVKIGHTTRPVFERLENIQAMCATKLTLLGFTYFHINAERAEKWLHGELGIYKDHGEWYRYTPRVQTYLRAALQITPQCVLNGDPPKYGSEEDPWGLVNFKKDVLAYVASAYPPEPPQLTVRQQLELDSALHNQLGGYL